MKRLLFILSPLLTTAAFAQGPVHGNDDYLVVASERLRQTDGWMQVAGALKAKHSCDWVFYTDELEEILPALKSAKPRLIGLVAMPTEAGHEVVREMNRLVRRIDDDPYADAQWGLITGSRWEDAMEVVREEKPLVIQTALANTPIPIERVGSGTYFDEGVAGRRVEARQGEQAVEVQGEEVIAEDFAAAFNSLNPDLLVTSGRTNEERWMLGYTFDGGRVVVEEGDLCTRTPDGRETPLRNDSPMAMIGAGSCLLGHVPDEHALPLAFIRHGGARQIIGYATTTWYGRGGWDTLSRVMDEPGRNSIAQAAWLTQQNIVREIEALHPGLDIDTNEFGPRDVVEFRTAVAEETGLLRGSEELKEITGLLWDRDALVVLGDPAWDVRLRDGERRWEATVLEEANTWTVTFRCAAGPEDCTNIAFMLPEVLINPRMTDDGGSGAVLCEEFILLPELEGTITIVFEAEKTSEPLVAMNPEKIQEAIELVPGCRAALKRAKGNGGEIARALLMVKPEHLDAMAYLVMHMPEHDLQSLPAAYLVEHVEMAYAAKERSPWGAEIPDEIFYDAVVPYAHITERRDDWRADFTERFASIAWEAPTQEEAVRALNEKIFKQVNVVFDANKRLKNDQSPYQTFDQECASCTGLSIMLANACRSAGIPARLAGIPLWLDNDGNHTWVEVWDNGRWHWIEAYAPAPYGQAWWVEKVGGIAKQNLKDPRNRIWASTWRKASEQDVFPLPWVEPGDPVIPGEDRTAAYVWTPVTASD